MPELREALATFRPTPSGSGTDPSANLVPMFTASLRETFNEADRSTEAIPPAVFVQVIFGCAALCCIGRRQLHSSVAGRFRAYTTEPASTAELFSIAKMVCVFM